MSAHNPDDLRRIYSARFDASRQYRDLVWQVLLDDFFQQFIRPDDRVLDLGCGYGEFIRQVRCGARWGMDLNPESPRHVGDGVTFLQQGLLGSLAARGWGARMSSLRAIFEHLPDKAALGRTLDEIHRCLAPGGRLIAMGPNIAAFWPAASWDFWDHYVPLSEKSPRKRLTTRAFQMLRIEDRFLPYSMVGRSQSPMMFLRAYPRLPLAWKIFGRQFWSSHASHPRTAREHRPPRANGPRFSRRDRWFLVGLIRRLAALVNREGIVNHPADELRPDHFVRGVGAGDAALIRFPGLIPGPVQHQPVRGRDVIRQSRIWAVRRERIHLQEIGGRREPGQQMVKKRVVVKGESQVRGPDE